MIKYFKILFILTIVTSQNILAESEIDEKIGWDQFIPSIEDLTCNADPLIGYQAFLEGALSYRHDLLVNHNLYEDTEVVKVYKKLSGLLTGIENLCNKREGNLERQGSADERIRLLK